MRGSFATGFFLHKRHRFDVQAATYWRAMWTLLALGGGLLFFGVLAFGTGFGAPLLWLAAISLLGGLLTLRMWMWQKAYEGKANDLANP